MLYGQLLQVTEFLSVALWAFSSQYFTLRTEPGYLFSDVTECTVCVSGYDPLTFSFLPFLLFDWVGILWPQLSKVLKLVRWARRVPFPPVSLQ